VYGFIFSYKEINQLNYSNQFRVQENGVKKEFVIYPDTTINSETFKIHLTGYIEGSATISALAIHRTKKGSLNSNYIINLRIKNKSDIDTTLRVPYYGSLKGDKVVLFYKPESVQRVNFTIKAGSFGLPFEKLLTHLL
jgi:hypothetical protein